MLVQPYMRCMPSRAPYIPTRYACRERTMHGVNYNKRKAPMQNYLS